MADSEPLEEEAKSVGGVLGGVVQKDAWRWGTKTQAQLSYLSLSDCFRRCRSSSRVQYEPVASLVLPMRGQSVMQMEGQPEQANVI